MRDDPVDRPPLAEGDEAWGWLENRLRDDSLDGIVFRSDAETGGIAIALYGDKGIRRLYPTLREAVVMAMLTWRPGP